MTDLAIQLNNCATKEPCALCQRIIGTQVGPVMFVMGTWDPVCEDCGKEHAPDLLLALCRSLADSSTTDDPRLMYCNQRPPH